MVRVGVPGVSLKDLVVQTLGIGQLARLMMPQCQSERFRNGGHKGSPQCLSKYRLLQKLLQFPDTARILKQDVVGKAGDAL